LVTGWAKLLRRVGRSGRDFVAVVSQSTSGGRIDLEGVYTSSGG
jgi:hypothetical protein